MESSLSPPSRTSLSSALSNDAPARSEYKNEAFSSVVLAWQQETGADLSKVNVHGGAIALGHPLGASGTRLTTTLVHAMRERGARYALQTMCEAGGLANAMILERV